MSFPVSELAAQEEPLRAVGVLVRTVAVAGVLLFGVMAIVTAMAPAVVERAAHGYVSQRLQGELEALTGGSVDLTKVIADPGLRERYAAALGAFGGKVPEALDRLFAKLAACLCQHDCAARTKARAVFDTLMAAASADMRALAANLQAIAQGRFDLIFAKLRHELLLISTINAVIFGILLLACVRFPTGRAVVVPAAMLTISTLTTACLYFIGKNWWWTVLTDGYWGMGYLALDAFVLAFLVDILFFEGRITNGVIESISDMFSSLLLQC